MKKSEIIVLCSVLAILVVVVGWYFSLEEKNPTVRVWQNSHTEEVALIPDKELSEVANFLAQNAQAVIPLNGGHTTSGKSSGLLMVINGETTQMVYVTERGRQPDKTEINEGLEYFLPNLKVKSWKISSIREYGNAVMHFLKVKF